MKRFKELTEELLNEGGEMYPADEMTISELKIACYSAQNILERLKEGAMIQRWQISAIVKAKEELAAVYTAMSADEGDDDEWEDEMEDEEPMYVGFEYPSMYGEEVELKQNLTELFDKPYPYKLNIRSDGAEAKIKLPDKTTLNVMFLKGKTKWDMAFDRDGSFDAEDQGDQYKVLSTVVAVFMDFVNKVKPVKITFDADKDSTGSRTDLYTRMLNRYADKMGYDFKVKNPMGDSILQYTLTKKSIKEETDYEVDVEGLPKMYVKANNPGEVKTNLRKVVRNPELIRGVERVAKATLQKIFRDKASGKDTEE